MATSSNSKAQQIIDDLLFIFDKKEPSCKATLAPIFQNWIKIPENTQESRKFVSKPIQFDEIMGVDQKLKDIVYGYINKVKSYLCLNQIPFSIIPKEICCWCLLYVHDSFSNVIRDIYNNGIPILIGAVREIRILISGPDKSYQEPVHHLIETGIIPRIVQLLTHNQHPELQYECSWSLANVALETKAVSHMIHHGAHIQLIELLKSSPYYQVKD